MWKFILKFAKWYIHESILAEYTESNFTEDIFPLLGLVDATKF